SEVARVATILGRAVGQDATKSVDDLTVALARQSPMILDNLGVKMNLTEATAQYAASLGKTVDALTEEERKLAFASAAMEAARQKADDLGTAELTVWEQAGRVAVAFGDLGAAAIAAGDDSATLAGTLGGLADSLGRIRSEAPGAMR